MLPVTDPISAFGQVKGYYEKAEKIFKWIYGITAIDPTQQAIEKLQHDVAELRADLDKVKANVLELARLETKETNATRVEDLNQHLLEIRGFLNIVALNPDDVTRLKEAAFGAGTHADHLARDERLWSWTELVTEPIGSVRVVDDFRPGLALVVYSLALAAWTTAIILAHRGDHQTIKRLYGDQLREHMRAVSVRESWTSKADGVTRAEKIRFRLHYTLQADHKYVEDGACHYTLKYENLMDGDAGIVQRYTQDRSGEPANTLCTIDPGFAAGDEKAHEDTYTPLIVLNGWHEVLSSLAATGHMPVTPFVGVFPTSVPSWQVIFYAVRKDGQLHMFKQDHGPETTPIEGPIDIGNGWNFRQLGQLVSGGSSVLMAVGSDNFWTWYRHKWPEGRGDYGDWYHESRREPIDRNMDWARNRMVFGGGYGAVYGIALEDEPSSVTKKGDLQWTRKTNTLASDGPFKPVARVGTGWHSYEKVFSMGEGVIYGIAADGNLYWHRHKGAEDGNDKWYEDRPEDPIGTGWHSFDHVFPAGSGFIYAVRPTGVMSCYRHRNWDTGHPNWDGPIHVNGDWREYVRFVAALPGEVPGPR